MKKLSSLSSIFFGLYILFSACTEQKENEQATEKQNTNTQQEEKQPAEKKPKVTPENIGEFILDIDDFLNIVYQWENKRVTLIGHPTSSIVRKDSVHFNFGWVGLATTNKGSNSEKLKMLEVPIKDLNYENKPVAANDFLVTSGIIKSINCYGNHPCFILFEPDTLYITSKKPETNDFTNGLIDENKTYEVGGFYEEVLKFNNKQAVVAGKPTNYNVSKTLEGEFKSCNIVIKNKQGSILTCIFNEPQEEHVKPNGPNGGFASNLSIKGTIELKRFRGRRSTSLNNCTVVID